MELGLRDLAGRIGAARGRRDTDHVRQRSRDRAQFVEILGRERLEELIESRGARLAVVRLEDPRRRFEDLDDGPVRDALAVREALPPVDVEASSDAVDELVQEPALANPGRPHQSSESDEPIVRQGVAEREEFAEFRVAADEGRLGARPRLRLFLHAGDFPHLDGLRLPFRLDRLGFPERKGVLRREVGRAADEDAVGRCGRLDPRGRIEHVAGGRPLSLARPRPEHHERLAGVDPGPDMEVEPLVLLVQLGDSLSDRERGADGTLRIVLVRLRRAEERQNGIAAELLEGAAVPLELAADARVVGRYERSHVFGIEIFRACGRADEVDEDRGDDLAFLARRRCGGERTPAEAAKPELGGIRFATRWADGGRRLGGLGLDSCERGAAEAANAELVGVLLTAAGADLHGFECTSRFGLAQSRGGLGERDLQAFARDERRLLVVPDRRGHLVVERLELVIRAHGIVVEHRELADSGGAREG